VLLGGIAIANQRLKAATVGRRFGDGDAWTHQTDSHIARAAGIPYGILVSDFIH